MYLICMDHYNNRIGLFAAQTPQKVQILKSADGKLQVKGLMPGKLYMYSLSAFLLNRRFSQYTCAQIQFSTAVPR